MIMMPSFEEEQQRAMEEVIVNQFTTAVSNHDMLGITRGKHFIENLPAIEHHDLYASIIRHDRYKDAIGLADNAIRDWVHSLPVGSLIDVFLEREKTWYQAKVLVNNSPIDDSLRVRYQGWGPKYDETIKASKSRVAVQGAFMRRVRKKATKIRNNDEGVQPSSCDDVPTASAADNDNQDLKEDGNTVATTAEETDYSDQVKKSRSGRRMKEMVSLLVDGDDGDKVSDSKRRRSFKSADDAVDKKDLNDWICGICARFEAPDGSDLMLCEGKLINTPYTTQHKH